MSTAFTHTNTHIHTQIKNQEQEKNNYDLQTIFSMPSTLPDNKPIDSLVLQRFQTTNIQ